MVVDLTVDGVPTKWLNWPLMVVRRSAWIGHWWWSDEMVELAVNSGPTKWLNWPLMMFRRNGWIGRWWCSDEVVELAVDGDAFQTHDLKCYRNVLSVNYMPYWIVHAGLFLPSTTIRWAFIWSNFLREVRLTRFHEVVSSAGVLWWLCLLSSCFRLVWNWYRMITLLVTTPFVVSQFLFFVGRDYLWRFGWDPFEIRPPCN